MAKTAILAIKIIGDATRAARALKQTETGADKMSRRMASASKVASRGLFALGGAALVSARNAAKDQKGQVLLAQAQRKAAGATRAQIAATENYITKTSRAAAVSDDELRPALAALVRSTGSVKTAQRDLNQALDIAAATGKPVTDAAKAMARAHAGNTTALGRLVPGIDKAVLKSGNYNKIMKELARTTGGSAAKAANSAEGKTRKMSIAFDEASESAGVVLLPILTKLATILATVGIWVQNNTRLVTIIAGVLGTLAVSVIAVNTAYKSYKAITQAAKTAQLAFNIVMAANPIGLIVVAVIALIAAFILAYKHSARFRGIVQATGRAGKAALGWIVDKAQAVWSSLKKLGPVINTVKDIAKRAFKVWALQFTIPIDAIKKLIGWIKKIHFPKPPKWVSKAAGLIGLGGAPTPPKATVRRVSVGGAGGPSGGGSVLVAQRGNSGSSVQINIYGPIDAEQTVRKLRTMFRQSDLRRGVVTV